MSQRNGLALALGVLIAVAMVCGPLYLFASDRARRGPRAQPPRAAPQVSGGPHAPDHAVMDAHSAGPGTTTTGAHSLSSSAPTTTVPTRLAPETIIKLDLNAKDWQTRHGSNVADTWSVRFVDEDAAHAPALDFQRGESQNDGGSAGATRKLDLSVAKYRSLVLKADVKVLDYTLRGSGWWYDTHPGEGDYPVHLFVEYLDAQQRSHVWSRGFLTIENPNQKTNYDRISPGQWYSFLSQNLMTFDPSPTIVTAITIRGSGWDFHGQAANVELRYTTKTE